MFFSRICLDFYELSFSRTFRFVLHFEATTALLNPLPLYLKI